MHQGSFLISSLMLPFPKLGIFALTVQRMLDHDIKAAHTHEERERERDEYAPCMHRVSWRACATPCIHTRPRPRRLGLGFTPLFTPRRSSHCSSASSYSSSGRRCSSPTLAPEARSSSWCLVTRGRTILTMPLFTMTRLRLTTIGARVQRCVGQPPVRHK